MHRTRTALLGAVAVLTLLAGCGGTEEADAPEPSRSPSSEDATPSESTGEAPTEAPSSSPTEPSTAAADSLPPFPGDTRRQFAEPRGAGALVFTDIRVGEHDGYDRLVLEFRGKGTPGWSVGYVKQVVQEGSGQKISLEGEAFLDLYASGTTYPAEGSTYYDGPRQFEPEDGGDIEDVYVGGTFEGLTQVAVGVDDGRVPFRVFTLSKPTRLVVDLQSD